MRLIENYLYEVFIDMVWKTGLPRTIFQPLIIFVYSSLSHCSFGSHGLFTGLVLLPSSAFPATFVIFAPRIIFTLIIRKIANRMCACFKSLLQKQMLQPVTTFWELQDEKGKSIGDKGGASSSDLYRSMFFFIIFPQYCLIAPRAMWKFNTGSKITIQLVESHCSELPRGSSHCCVFDIHP